MWSTPPEAEQTPRSRGYALWVVSALLLATVTSNLLIMRPSITGKADHRSTKVLEVEFTLRILYGRVPPFNLVDQKGWDDVLKRLTAKDAPLESQMRAVIITYERAHALGMEEAQKRIAGLLQQMPNAPTRFSSELRENILRWCRIVYAGKRPIDAQELARLRQVIDNAQLGWTRYLALKHLEFRAGNVDAARQWDVKANQEAEKLQQWLLVIAAVVVLMVLLGMLSWGVYAVWKTLPSVVPARGSLLPPHQTEPVLWGMCAYLAASYIGGWVGGGVARLLPPSQALLVPLLALVQVTTGGIALWVLHTQMVRHGIRWRDLGLVWKSLPSQLAWGSGAYLATVPVLILAVLLARLLIPSLPTPGHPIAGVAAAENPFWVKLALFLIAAVFAPIFEEIFFRGVLLNAIWARTASKWAGILLSALVFSILHPQLYLGWIAIFAIGVMLGAVFVEKRSLIPCIWMHALNNTLALLATQALRVAG